MTLVEFLKYPLATRLASTGTKNLTSFTLDTETYSGYKGYSFFWELTLVSEPERSSSGVIDLSSNAYFITPHLRIDFSVISYQDFQRLRQQQLSKLYFNLTCFDTDFGETITEEVYFHPDTLPNFVTMARKLNGEKWTEIIGASNYTIELVGTNRTAKQATITYFLNEPHGSNIGMQHTSVEKKFPKNSTVGVGNNALIQTGTEEATGNPIYTKISDITFEDKFRFLYWNTRQDGVGFKYIDGDEYFLRGDIKLYAVWEPSA